MAVLFVAAAACSSDQPTEPRLGSHGNEDRGAEPQALSVDSSNAPDFAEVALPLPAQQGLGRRDETRFKQEVAAAGGVVLIGIKEDSARSTDETGRVAFLSRRSFRSALDSLTRRGIKVQQELRNTPAVVATLSPDSAAALRTLPFINYIEAASPFRLASSRASASLLMLTAQDTTWGIHKINAVRVWQGGYRGQGAFLTMLDDGVDAYHAFNALGDGPANLPVFDCLYVVYPGITNCYSTGHGSGVAGVMAAINNGFGVVGVAHAPLAFASVKVCSEANGLCWTPQIAGGLDWTTTKALNGRRPQIVNMSFYADDITVPSGSNYLTVADAVARSAAAGNLLVAAAGNFALEPARSQTLYPAGYPEVISVAGTNSGDGTYGGNRNADVELSAPAEAYSLHVNGLYMTRSGTSFAAPFVSATAALVWSRFPSWTAAQVRLRLQQTAVDLGSPGRDPIFGFGRIDANCAVYFVVPCTPFVVTASAPGYVTAKATYQLTGSATHSASGWVWTRSLDGGVTWTAWATSQNTAFTAFAGSYTIDWRLIATRAADGQADTSFAATTVCTLGSGCGGPLAQTPLQAPVSGR